MSLDRAPDAAAGVSVFSVIAVQWATDPLQVVLTFVGIVAGVGSFIANLPKIAASIRQVCRCVASSIASVVKMVRRK
jgi:hypothetical protein